MTEPVISRAGPADLDALALMFDAYRQFYGQSSDVPRARDWLRSRLRVGESVVLLARRGGAMLGFFCNGMMAGYGTLLSENYTTDARSTAQNFIFNTACSVSSETYVFSRIKCNDCFD